MMNREHVLSFLKKEVFYGINFIEGLLIAPRQQTESNEYKCLIGSTSIYITFYTENDFKVVIIDPYSFDDEVCTFKYDSDLNELRDFIHENAKITLAQAKWIFKEAR